MTGDGKVGSMRHYTVVSGLPAASSTERLEVLDDEKHVLSFKIVGGEHRLRNYRSITTVHQDQAEGNIGTFVVESYVVDIPEGNTMEETCIFANTLVRCNLQSLAKLAEERASLNANVSPAAAAAKLFKNTIM
ncbi:hypothetical protein O6H91_11G004700 [Diphasiastrum complanatum]|nr:hypothetical protein O6H91_11G004700 [Diphasiastrum complanatum]